jgi:hypothetical protein
MGDLKINEIILEKYLLGELPPKLIQKVESKIQKDASLHDKILKLKASNQKFFQEYPEDEVFSKIESEQEKTESLPDKLKPLKTPLLRKILYLSPVLATMVLIFALVIPWIITNMNDPNQITQVDKNQIKGPEIISNKKTQLLIFRKSDKGIETLADKSLAKEGDLLQLAYITDSQKYGLIFSIDGNGLVTLLLPEDKNQSTSLVQKKRVYLPHSHTLDDAPRFERFFLVTSDKEIEIDSILHKARHFVDNAKNAETDSLNLGSSFQEFSILIKKEEKQ